MHREDEFVVRRYAHDDAAAWNAFVDASRNGTFLLRRDYMEYHAERFEDASLVVSAGGRLAALFPANRSGSEIASHAGLTHGGLVLADDATAESVGAIWDAIVLRLRRDAARRVVYKTIPTIYHRLPTEMDRDVLARSGARLVRREVLSAISPSAEWCVSPSKRRSVNRAERTPGVEIGVSHDWAAFWAVLRERLGERYGVTPVHSLAEIEMLAARFPSSIRLVTATVAGAVAAGTVLYESANVVRTQYMATNARARTLRLLDSVLGTAIRDARARGKWFDLGSSVGGDGTFNAGVALYKSRLGGHDVVHDVYALDFD